MILITNFKAPLEKSLQEIKLDLEKTLGENINRIEIIKKAVDSRKKNVQFVYTLGVTVFSDENKLVKKLKNKDISIDNRDIYKLPVKGKPGRKIIICGSGPAGLFSAFVLSKLGYEPTLIERGNSVENRTKDVENFKKTRKLNIESNIQFGEGGAGTFSDGKLHTGIKDTRVKFVIDTFADFAEGNAEELRYMNKPHIGTDRLVKIIANMRNDIIKNGGKVLFNTCLTGIVTSNNRLVSVKIIKDGNEAVLDCDDLILAIGHSARDTVKMLYDSGVKMEQKPFAVGLRVEHKREMIDKSQYGNFAGRPELGAADYKLVARPNGLAGVYSFCMCPGGIVVPASSEDGRLVVNGMSNSKRDAENSNSALLVGVSQNELKSTDVFAGIEFQRNLERLAFEIGGSDYKAPAQLVGDFVKNQPSKSLGNINPSYEMGTTLCNLRDILPSFVGDSISASFPIFGQMIDGYDSYDAVLTGVESRSSSPVRLYRDEITFESNISGIYPCGEGAGYAGGIVSAAVDGIKCAEKIIEKA